MASANDSSKATQPQKFFLALSLIIMLVVTCGLSYWSLQKIQQNVTADAFVNWPNANNAKVAPGPVAFLYNADKHELHYRGQITDEVKLQILSLITTKDPTYEAAIDRLAFNSAAKPNMAVYYLLLLGGLGGILGVQIRSTYNFVGNACYTNNLDVAGWWPWYFLRPALGFLLGSLVVAMIKSDVFVTKEAFHGDLGWLSVAVIAGFGAEDVMGRLRLMSKTLFGDATDKVQPPPNKGNKKSTPSNAQSEEDPAPIEEPDHGQEE